MSNNLPINWQEEMARQAKAVSRAFRPSTAQISTKSGMMRYMGQPVPNNQLDVIVLGAIFENNYFEGKYDPMNPRNPVCFAFGRVQEDGSKPEMLPPPEVVKKEEGKGYARQDERCDLCPWSKWNSDPNSMTGKGKRCKEFYKLGLIPRVAGGTDEMAILRIPVTSRKNFDVYVNGVAASSGRPLWGVLTRISIAPHPKNQFEIKFEFRENLTDEELGKIFPKIEGAYEALMEPYDPNANPLEQKPPVEEKKRKF